VFRDLMVTVDQAVRQLTRELEAKAPKVLPKAMGRLTYEAVEPEVAAWEKAGVGLGVRCMESLE